MKEFNTEGTCYPDLHYMMDNSAKLAATMALVERGKYFIINRPRQYGKTTMLYTLNESLLASDNYLSIFISFQGVGESVYESDSAFARFFFHAIFDYLEIQYPKLKSFLQGEKDRVADMVSLSKFISKFV